MNAFEAYAAYGKILAGLRHIRRDTFLHIALMEVAKDHIGPPIGYYICDSRHDAVLVPHFGRVIDWNGWH